MNWEDLNNSEEQIWITFINKIWRNDPSETKTIYIDNFILTPERLTDLIDALRQNTHVSLLCINAQWIQVDEYGFRRLANLLAETKVIKRVNIYGDAQMNLTTFQYLADGLKRNKSINELHVTWNSMCHTTLKALLDTFESNEGLTKFTLINGIQLPNYNAKDEQNSQVGETLCYVLQNDKVLKSMTLYGSTMTSFLAGWFSNGLRSNQCITDLSLLDCNISDYGMIALIDGVLSNENNVNVLSLAGTRIAKCVAETLAKKLKRLDCSLISFDLSRCDVCTEGMIAILNAVLINQSISSINLDQNTIENNSMQAMVSVLETNKVLQNIAIRNCSLGDETISVFAKGLLRNHTLLSVDFSSNAISNCGVESISKALKRHPTLEVISLLDTAFTIEGLPSLLQALRCNEKLSVLKIPEDLLLDDAMEEYLAELLKYNDTLQEIRSKNEDSENEEEFYHFPIPRSAPYKRRRLTFTWLTEHFTNDVIQPSNATKAKTKKQKKKIKNKSKKKKKK